MSRDANVAVVEAFFRHIVDKQLARLPIDTDFTTQSPLTPKLSGRAAIDYLERVAANVTAIHIKQHIVEGDWVATLLEEETTHGSLEVFSKFHVVGDRIKEVTVFYDPRRILPGT
jgi:hypothetical protein